MTPTELWMKWQAENTPAPMAICALVVEFLERDYGVIITPSGTAVVHDGNDCHRSDLVTLPRKWRRAYGFEVTRHAPNLMRCWAYRFAGNGAYVQGDPYSFSALACNDPEVIEWAKAWKP